jgi:hypothetical protein
MKQARTSAIRRVPCVVAAAMFIVACGSESTVDVEQPADGGSAVDCAALERAVDERWGTAPDVATRLEHFDSLWAHIGSTYAGFTTLPLLDWDAVRETYRPKFENAERHGRFFTLTAELMHLVHDVHSVIWSKRVCDTPRSERPPLFARYDYTIASAGLFGVCGTPLDDDRLLVYHVEPDNPAGLEPGDLILGYDGVPWSELATALEACHIPTCGYHRAAAVADHRLLMSTVMFNAHLFKRLDVQRYGSTEIESIPTDDLLAYESTLECAEQIAPDGVELPWTDYGVTPLPAVVSWGRVAGNIGYIYVFSWAAGGASLFDSAVAELMDTDGLIIDMRNHSGGGPVVGRGTALLFGEDVLNVLRRYRRPTDSDYDVLEPFDSLFNVHVVADPSTFYDRPIAVLTGPKTQGGGESSSFVYSKHPRARRFGRATSGDFGSPGTDLGIAGLYTPVAALADDFVGVWYPLPSLTGVVLFDSEGQIMLRSEQTPETEVWFTQDDVAAGRDTVVEAALAWIAEENGASRLPATGTGSPTPTSR